MYRRENRNKIDGEIYKVIENQKLVQIKTKIK